MIKAVREAAREAAREDRALDYHFDIWSVNADSIASTVNNVSDMNYVIDLADVNQEVSVVYQWEDDITAVDTLKNFKHVRNGIIHDRTDKRLTIRLKKYFR